MKRATVVLSVVLPLLLCTAMWAAQNFTHIVIVVQENRTPDNLFQGLCMPPFGNSTSCSITPSSTQYNISTSNWLDKTSPTKVTQPLTIPLVNKYDLDHSHHPGWIAQCDSVGGVCLMDGAAGVSCKPNASANPCPAQPQFRYVYDPNNPTQLDPYFTLVTQYGWANYMFQTNQGPSFPAHQFIFGGTSAPTAADDAQAWFAATNPSPAGRPAGCIAAEGTTVGIITPGTTVESIYPCFEHQTAADMMSGVGTWRYYAPSPGHIWTAPNAISHICQSTGYSGNCAGWGANVVLNPAQILIDIKNCNLANLSWAIPTGQNSDHAGGNKGGGPDWVASIVNAIGTNPTCPDSETYWDNTAIVVTWDDWGGWYDHVAPEILPGVQGDYQYGFRVPLLFVSAYTPIGYIDNNQHDFGSILRFVEANFGLVEGGLGFADARSTDNLSTFYSFTQDGTSRSPRAFKAIPTKITIQDFINDKSPAEDPDDD